MCGFPGKDHAGIDSGVNAAGDIRIKAVADYESLFFGKAGDFKAVFHHLFIRLSKVYRSFSGGRRNHSAHGAAVGNKTEINGAAQIRVGGVKGNPRGRKYLADCSKLVVSQFAVVGGDNAGDILLRCFGNGEAAFSQFFEEGSGSHDKDFLICIVGFQETNGHKTGSNELILRRFKIKVLFKFSDIILTAFGGVVGNIKGFASDRLNVVQKFKTSVIKGISHGNSAVNVK